MEAGEAGAGGECGQSLSCSGLPLPTCLLTRAGPNPGPPIKPGHPMVLPEAGLAALRVLSSEGESARVGSSGLNNRTILSTAGFLTVFKMLMGFMKGAGSGEKRKCFLSRSEHTNLPSPSPQPSPPPPPAPPHPCSPTPTSTRGLAEHTLQERRFCITPPDFLRVTLVSTPPDPPTAEMGAAAGGRWAQGSECRAPL